MSAHMSLRDLYLPAGQAPDLPAAKTLAGVLCQTAGVDELRVLLEHDHISHADLYQYDPSDEQIAAHLDELRATAELELGGLLDAFAASLACRDVSRYPFDRPTGAANGRHTIDAYVTAGVTADGGPTESSDAWDIVFETDKFPPGWCDQLGAALGLLHPTGDGPARATATFYLWAASATTGQADAE